MTTPRPLLCLHSSDELYGSDRVLIDILTNLDPTRFRPIVVVSADQPGSGALSQRVAEAGVEVQRRHLAVLRRRYLQPTGMFAYLRHLTADVRWLTQLCRNRQVSTIYSNTTAVQSGALVAKRLGIRHVWHVHEIITSPRPLAWLLRWNLMHLSHAVIAVSNAVGSWIGGDRAGSRLSVIHNGIGEAPIEEATRQRLRKELLGNHGGPLIGWLGRISSWKGHEVFLELAQRAAPQHPGTVFLMAGGAVPGEDHRVSHLAAAISASGLGDRLRYLGQISDGPELVAAMDLLVACPSRPDPFPRVVQEALWQGVPVLGVRTGGLPEMIVDGMSGVLVERADPALLAEALDRLLEGQRLVELGSGAQEDARSRFGLQPFLARIEAVLDGAEP